MRLFATVFCVLAAAPACSAPGTARLAEELPAPVLWWEHGNALCSRVRAADSTGALWHDRGCEDGRFTFERIGRLSADDVAALEAAVTRFPTSSSGTACTGGMMHRFVRRTEDGRETSWRVCGTSPTEGSIAGLEGPFREVALVLNQS